MWRYLAMYKPFGVLTAFTDAERTEFRRPTLKEYVSIPDVYPVGRLDFRSEGLLILTDDGRLAHYLTHPDYEHPKTYLVQVEGLATPQNAARLREGVEVRLSTRKPGQGKVTEVLRAIAAEVITPPELPPRPVPVREYHPTSWIKIVLQEGKKHQVRHMTAALGLPTLRLVRVAIGPLALGDLQPGQWRHLSPREIDRLVAASRGRKGGRSKASGAGERDDLD